jgi:anti-anti-sigma factor
VDGDGARSGPGREPAVADVREENGATVVRLSGELDLHNADDVRAALEQASANGSARIVVDLSAVEFLDSTVLGVFVQAHRRARGDASFRLASPGPEPRRILQVAGVETYLDVHDSLDDALRS